METSVNIRCNHCQELVRSCPGFIPDRRDLVPPPIVDGLSGEDLGLATAQLVAAQSQR